MSILLMF